MSGFPVGSYNKESACNAGDPGSIPRLGRSPEEKNGPTLVFLSGESYGQRSLADYSPWGPRESDMTRWLTHTHTRTHAHTRTHTHTHTCARTHAHAHTRVHTCARTHAHARTRTHTCTHTHTQSTMCEALLRGYSVEQNKLVFCFHGAYSLLGGSVHKYQ